MRPRKEIEQILIERGKSYGSYKDNCKVLEAMQVALESAPKFKSLPTTTRYAIIVILMKIVRLGCGGFHEDSLRDIAGYATLALEDKEEQQ